MDDTWGTNAVKLADRYTLEKEQGQKEKVKEVPKVEKERAKVAKDEVVTVEKDQEVVDQEVVANVASNVTLAKEKVFQTMSRHK